MKKIYPILVSAIAILASSCVTNEYDLTNINTEIHVGSDVIELPIGHIDTLTVDSLLQFLGDIEYLKTESNGNLQIAFDSAMSYTIPAIEIEPLDNIIPTIEPITVGLNGESNSFPTDFNLPDQSYEYTAQIPTYTINDESTKLPAINFAVTIPPVASLVNGIPVPSGLSIPLSIDGKEDININFPCPTQVKRINKVWFAGKGAHVKISFSLGGLSSIATNNTINNLVVNLPEIYELGLENNLNGCASLNAKGNKLTITNYQIGASGKVTISAYLKSVDMSGYEAENGKISCKGTLTYDLEYGFTTKAGTVSINPAPSLEISIENATFGDAEIVSNPITIPAIEQNTALKYDFKDLSPELDRVLHIDFKEGSGITLKLSVNNGETIPFKGWNECPIIIGLPECFRLDSSKLQNATFNESSNTLSTTIGAISSTEGLHLPIKKIDFGEGLQIEVSTDENGKKTGAIHLNEQLYIKITPELPSATYRLSDITKAMGDKKIQVSLSDTHLIIAPESSEIVINNFSTKIPDFEEVINYSISNLRSEIKKIENLKVTDSEGNDVILDVAFSLSECPVNHLELRNIKVELPKCLWVEGEGIDENNVMTINKTVDMNENSKISLATIKIKGIKDLNVDNGTLTINDKVKFSGEIAIPKGEVLHGTSNDIVITPMINLPTLHITEFVGRVNINVNEYVEPQTIDLSEFTSQLQNNNLDIDFGLVPPVICVDVANPFGVDIDGAIKLTAHYPDSTTLPLNVPLHLNGAQGEQRGISKLCITNKTANAPEGYTAVTPENYDKLFSKIPSSLDFMVEGSIDENTVCNLALGEDYNIDLAMALDLPVALNADIQLEGVFGDLGGTFDKIVEYDLNIGEVGIVIETKSTLPIELSAEVMAVDSLGNKVDGIELNIEGTIGGCENNGAPKTSTLAVSVSGDITKLKDVDALKYTLKGAITAEEAAYFNINQYLTAKAYARIEEGVTFDLEMLLGGEPIPNE